MLAGEAVSNIRTVAAFCAEQKVLDLYANELVEPSKRSFNRGQIAGIFYGISQFFIFSSYGLALWYVLLLLFWFNSTLPMSVKCLLNGVKQLFLNKHTCVVLIVRIVYILQVWICVDGKRAFQLQINYEVVHGFDCNSTSYGGDFSTGT